MLWFPNEAHYRALKLQTDINLLPLLHEEDKNFRGSLYVVLDFRKWWRHMKMIYDVWLQKISIPQPWRELEFQRGGGIKDLGNSGG